MLRITRVLSLFCQQAHSGSTVTLIVRSSLPSDTRTLMGGSVGLVSWVSTVALIAFWQRTITVDENITEQTHGEGNIHLQGCWVLYLEKLKQHMVEMGWHIDNVEGLARVFSCGGIKVLITWLKVHQWVCSSLLRPTFSTSAAKD